MKKRCLIYLSIFGLLCLLSPNHAAAVTIFEDNFDGTELDSSKWVTPPDYYCANRCSISVSEGALGLNVPWIGNAYYYVGLFPYVRTAYNPFPVEEDWALTFQMRYMDINNKGDGFTLYGSPGSSSPIARVWQDSAGGAGFYLWEGNSAIKVWGASDLMEWAAFSIEKTGGQYRAYVNGALAGAVSDTISAGGIEMGSSAPNDGYGVWNPVQFDYVRLDTLSDPPPSQQPLPAPEPATGLLLLSGLCMGRLFFLRTKITE